MSEHNFKVGDRVEVVEKAFNGILKKGYKGRITSIDTEDRVNVDNIDLGWFYGIFGGELKLISVSYPNPPHKHAEIIKAWADGASIQARYNGNWERWKDVSSPSWTEDYEYRIKPEPTKEELEIIELEQVIKEAQEKIDKLKEDQQ